MDSPTPPNGTVVLDRHLQRIAKRYFTGLQLAHEQQKPHEAGAMSWYLGQARGFLLAAHELDVLSGREFSFWMFGISESVIASFKQKLTEKELSDGA